MCTQPLFEFCSKKDKTASFEIIRTSANSPKNYSRAPEVHLTPFNIKNKFRQFEPISCGQRAFGRQKCRKQLKAHFRGVHWARKTIQANLHKIHENDKDLTPSTRGTKPDLRVQGLLNLQLLDFLSSIHLKIQPLTSTVYL